MPLSPGDRLGPYEIVVAIGKGGMGEVWRARDPRLGRDVAIRISAQQFTDRFEREARAIAALNHSNICTLYDVGPNYLVMELVEGSTLAERIQAGPIPPEEALPIAKQIADALEAAHEKNIIHRDLKPANIKIRPDGSVKVLDFGLAKAGHRRPPGHSRRGRRKGPRKRDKIQNRFLDAHLGRDHRFGKTQEGFSHTLLSCAFALGVAIPFPWKRALPGLGRCLAVTIAFLTMGRGPSGNPPPAPAAPGLSMVLSAAGWIAAALALAFGSIVFSLRMARRV